MNLPKKGKVQPPRACEAKNGIQLSRVQQGFQPCSRKCSHFLSVTVGMEMREVQQRELLRPCPSHGTTTHSPASRPATQLQVPREHDQSCRSQPLGPGPRQPREDRQMDPSASGTTSPSHSGTGLSQHLGSSVEWLSPPNTGCFKCSNLVACKPLTDTKSVSSVPYEVGDSGGHSKTGGKNEWTFTILCLGATLFDLPNLTQNTRLGAQGAGAFEERTLELGHRTGWTKGRKEWCCHCVLH